MKSALFVVMECTIRQAVAEDVNMCNLSKEEVVELKAAVLEKRSICRDGMHALHTAASLDVHHTIRQLHHDLSAAMQLTIADACSRASYRHMCIRLLCTKQYR